MEQIERLNQELARAVEEREPGKSEQLVFGEGPLTPCLMLIGEAPGEQETLQHRPFVGKAGQNLNRFLELSGLKREELYISNTVKLRPVKVGKSGRLSNRPPTKEECAFFKPWLLREIEAVAPEMIAVLGNTPLHVLAGAKLTIGAVHGTLVPIEGTGRFLYALYHPASLIYNPSLAEVYESDIRALAKRLSG